jgi:hypothetical protein
MAVSLGYQAGTPTGSVGASGIIDVTWSESVDAIDVTHRGLAAATGASYKAATGGLVTNEATITCFDATAVIADLRSAGSSYTAVSVEEGQPIDGAVTYTITVRQK